MHFTIKHSFAIVCTQKYTNINIYHTYNLIKYLYLHQSDTSNNYMIKRTMIYLICCLWLMLFSYFIFKHENVKENYIQNTAYNHNALSGNSIGILQTKKHFKVKVHMLIFLLATTQYIQNITVLNTI